MAGNLFCVLFYSYFDIQYKLKGIMFISGGKYSAFENQCSNEQ